MVKGGLIMNQKQVNLILKMYNIKTKICLECELDAEFNQFISEKNIFKRSIDDIISDFNSEEFK
jgi:hypothetical protein